MFICRFCQYGRLEKRSVGKTGSPDSCVSDSAPTFHPHQSVWDWRRDACWRDEVTAMLSTTNCDAPDLQNYLTGTPVSELFFPQGSTSDTGSTGTLPLYCKHGLMVLLACFYVGAGRLSPPTLWIFSLNLLNEISVFQNQWRVQKTQTHDIILRCIKVVLPPQYLHVRQPINNNFNRFLIICYYSQDSDSDFQLFSISYIVKTECSWIFDVDIFFYCFLSFYRLNSHLKSRISLLKNKTFQICLLLIGRPEEFGFMKVFFIQHGDFICKTLDKKKQEEKVSQWIIYWSALDLFWQWLICYQWLLIRQVLLVSVSTLICC